MAMNGANKAPTRAVTITTTQTELSAGSPTGGSRTIQNVSASDIYIGPTGVTTSNGIKLLAATSTVIQSFTDTISQDAWYGIVASGTAEVRILETY